MSLKSRVERRERAQRWKWVPLQRCGSVNDRLANDVRRNGTHSSGTDDDLVLRALVRNEMCWLRYCGDNVCWVLNVSTANLMWLSFLFLDILTYAYLRVCAAQVWRQTMVCCERDQWPVYGSLSRCRQIPADCLWMRGTIRYAQVYRIITTPNTAPLLLRSWYPDINQPQTFKPHI